MLILYSIIICFYDNFSFAQKYIKHRIVTVAIESMSFIAPIRVGDFVSCYAEVERFGRTSLAIRIQTWRIGAGDAEQRQVSEGIFTYVSIDENRRPVPIL